MTVRKFLLRIYLWFFVTAFIIFMIRILVANGLIMERMADVRKLSVINLSRIYAILFFAFGTIYLFFKISRRRMKRALSNFHYFASCITYILITLTYSKMEGFGNVPKAVYSKEIAENPIIEAQTLLNMIYILFAIAQVMFIINIYIALTQKHGRSGKSDGKPVRRPFEKSTTAIKN